MGEEFSIHSTFYSKIKHCLLTFHAISSRTQHIYFMTKTADKANIQINQPNCFIIGPIFSTSVNNLRKRPINLLVLWAMLVLDPIERCGSQKYPYPSHRGILIYFPTPSPCTRSNPRKINTQEAEVH